MENISVVALTTPSSPMASGGAYASVYPSDGADPDGGKLTAISVSIKYKSYFGRTVHALDAKARPCSQNTPECERK